MPTLTKAEKRLIKELIQHFEDNKYLFEQFVEQLVPVFTNSRSLSPLIHSLKWRVKEPSHLRRKLVEKLLEAKTAGKPLAITRENLFFKINDLAGFRLIHLNTHQMEAINKALLDLFDEERLRLREGPV